MWAFIGTLALSSAQISILIVCNWRVTAQVVNTEVMMLSISPGEQMKTETGEQWGEYLEFIKSVWVISKSAGIFDLKCYTECTK